MQTRSILRAAGTAVSGALLVAACSSGGSNAKPTDSGIAVQPKTDNGTTSDDAPDACAIVTRADASTLFGQPATEKPSPADGKGGCIWTATAELPGGDTLRFSLVAHAYNGDAAYNENIAGGHRVAKVAERAYRYSIPGNDTIEFVDHDKTVVILYSIRTAGGDDAPRIADKETKLIALARAAAARI